MSSGQCPGRILPAQCSNASCAAQARDSGLAKQPSHPQPRLTARPGNSSTAATHSDLAIGCTAVR